MKKEIAQVSVIIVLMTGLVAGCVKIGYDEGVRSVKLPTCQHVLDKTPELIWNDDFETFPGEGELIRVELDDEDTIYLGPVIK
jgi:hypothetical protein